MSAKRTEYDLRHITDYIGFESFCNDLMFRIGYKKIEPLGGAKDKGRDALHVCTINGKTTIFLYSVRKDWREKLNKDLEKIRKHKHGCTEICYVTTSKLTATEKDNAKFSAKEKYNWDLEIYDLERIRVALDNQYSDLKKIHSHLFPISNELKLEITDLPYNREKYVEYLMESYKEWLEKYTSLLAKHRDIETLVVPASSQEIEGQGIQVYDIPSNSQIAILLGESGSGKTTALWKIIAESAKNLEKNGAAPIPIFINLRGWNEESRMAYLVKRELMSNSSEVDKILKSGNCLILVDGLNEISSDDKTRRNAYDDIQRFLLAYPTNKFVFSCRTSDYQSRMIDYEQLKQRLPEPKFYEIKRLDKNQVVDYVNRYFQNEQDKAEKLLAKIDVSNEQKWKEKTSILHLTRIPLYLQLIIDEFKRTGQLPNNRSHLLKTLVIKIIEREDLRSAALVERHAKESLLSSVAYRAIRQGYLLRIPDLVAKDIINNEILKLKERGMIKQNLTFDTIYRELLSNNFLKVVDLISIEWIHQLLLDYFLACSIINIRLNNKSKIKELNNHIKKYRQVWEQACVIALGLLDEINGADLLEELIQIDVDIARLAYEILDQDKALKIAYGIIEKGIKNDDPENIILINLAKALPYPPIVEMFRQKFKSSSIKNREKISQAISEMVIEYYAIILPKKSLTYDVQYKIESELKHVDKQYVKKGVKDGLSLLDAWINSQYEKVRFYSVKGLWEADKGNAARVLRELAEKESGISNEVRELIDQWGIQ